MPLATAPFTTWEYSDAQKAVNGTLHKNYERQKAYAVDQDHFQEGKEWVGPGDARGNDKIEQQFAPEDAVGEALSNIRNAFAEPQIGAAPLEPLGQDENIPVAIQSRMDEALRLLTIWWDAQKLQEKVMDRIWTAAWAGNAGLRLWVPGRFLTADDDGVGFKETQDLAQAMSYIHLATPLPEHAVIVVDGPTQDRCAIFMDEEVEIINGEKKTSKRAELIYLDPDRDTDGKSETIMRIVYSDPVKMNIEVRLPLGGKFLFSEMYTRTILTEPVLRTQQQLNLVASLVTRISETAAFRERYISNSKPQGIRIPYEEGDKLANGAFLERDEEDRVWQVVPQERTLGANTTTEIVGLPRYNTDGEPMGSETPTVTVVDPVDPGPYNEAVDAVRRRVLRMCSQGHLGGVSNFEASGVAYEQARAVFEKDLNFRRIAEEGMLREILTALLKLAEYITNKQGYFTSIMRITVDQRIDAGPRSPDIVRLDAEAYEMGLLSKETVMSRFGIEDIDAELSRIRGSLPHILGALETAGTLTTSFTADGILRVLEELGLPPKIMMALAPLDTDDLPPEIEDESN